MPDINHDARWRPEAAGDEPECGYSFRRTTCTRRGPHYCAPRADRVVAFFAELLVHIKGPFKRRPFILTPWQEHEIIRPLFGEVIYSTEWHCYARRYRIAHVVVARKNGKSELAAGVLLYLLVGDDEEAAEVYGAAKDTKQAGKIFEPAARMVQLSPRLRRRVKHIKNARRLVYDATGSYYEIITADAKGELGHNPHGFSLDEVLSQPDSSLWEAMTTAAGARVQELMLTTTTETNEPHSFGAELIDEADRVMEDPASAPHVFAFVRKFPRTSQELQRLYRLFPGRDDLPVSLDPFDERNWAWPNPALDDFLSRESLRRAAAEAKSGPHKENVFRQFRLNQRVQQATRFLSLDLWDVNSEPVELQPGETVWGGLDLSAKLDLTAFALINRAGAVKWRIWAPESLAERLDKETGGQFSAWHRAGWITFTEGDTIDFDTVYDDIAEDARRYVIVDITYDRWSGESVRQAIESRVAVEMVESVTTYEHMTQPLKELQRLLKQRELKLDANPVARWAADALEVKSPTDDPDRMRPVKPDRRVSARRIDPVVALLFAIEGRMAADLTEPNISYW